MADQQQNLKYVKEMTDKQREQVRIQEEYNEAIKMSSSLSSKLQDDIEYTVKTNAELGEKAKEYLGSLKSSISGLSSSKDISKKLVTIEQDKLKIQNNAFNLTQAENTALLEQLDIAKRALNIE